MTKQPTVDKQLFDIATTWKLLSRPGSVVEIRALRKDKWGSVVSGYFNNADEFEKSVAKLDRDRNIKAIYATLNPATDALSARAYNRMIDIGKKSPTTSDDDIVHRATILIDADPYRPSEIGSTDAEMAAAIAKRDEVLDYLYSLGSPAWVCGNSGNGAHALGKIDLPNDDASKQLVSDFLECLDWKFGTVPKDIAEAKRRFAKGEINVGIDTTVFNAARITKVFGTKVRKGDDTSERPHRYAELTSVPNSFDVIPTELLEIVAQQWRDYQSTLNKPAAPQHRAKAQSQIHNDWSATADGVERWLSDHGVTLGNRDTYGKNGYQYKWAVDCITCNGAHKDGAELFWGANKGLGYKCHHNGCKGKGWQDVRNLIEPNRSTVNHQAKYITPDEFESLLSAPSLSIDGILDNIKSIGTDDTLQPSDRKAKIVQELGQAIGDADRVNHSMVIDALADIDAGFTKTDARQFVANCVASAKNRKAQAQQQAQQQQQQQRQAAKQQSHLPDIQINDVHLRDIVSDAIDAIVQGNTKNPRIFVRGGALVRIAKNEREQHVIQELNHSSALSELSKLANWIEVRVNNNTEVETPAYPPAQAVSATLAEGEWSGVLPLTGIVHAPVFTEGGFLHSRPGYNRQSKLFYTGGVKIGSMSVDEAKRLIMDDLLVDFPFVDDASKAHAIGYMLLPFVRDLIDGPTPNHLATSPTPGTGKGKLMNACAYPALGHDIPSMTEAKDDEEWRKRLTTEFLSGSTHTLIDNVNRKVDSGALATAWTQPEWKDRLLGVNREARFPIRTIWAMTGNNVELSQELARRSVWIRLDSSLEKPWEKTGFKHNNLMNWVRDNRDSLATSAIVLIQAWVNAGMPNFKGRAKGSYESWANVIGGILQTVGIDGFLDNENELYETVISDADLMKDWVLAWWNKQEELRKGEEKATGQPCEKYPLSSKKLFKLASFADDPTENKLGGWENLLGDMLTAPKEHGRTTQLGRILNGHRDKVVAGCKICYDKTQDGSKYWRLEPAQVEPTQPTDEGSTRGSTSIYEGNNSQVEPSEPFSLQTQKAEKNIFDKKTPLQDSVNGKEKNIFISNGNGYASGSLGSTNEASQAPCTEENSAKSMIEPGSEVLPTASSRLAEFEKIMCDSRHERQKDAERLYRWVENLNDRNDPLVQVFAEAAAKRFGVTL